MCVRDGLGAILRAENWTGDRGGKYMAAQWTDLVKEEVR